MYRALQHIIKYTSRTWDCMKLKNIVYVLGIGGMVAGAFGAGTYYSRDVRAIYYKVRNQQPPRVERTGASPASCLLDSINSRISDESKLIREKMDSLRADLESMSQPAVCQDFYLQAGTLLKKFYDKSLQEIPLAEREKVIKEANVMEAESVLESYIKPESALNVNYQRAVTALDKFDKKQLEALDAETARRLQPKLTKEEKAEVGKKCANEYLNDFSQDDLQKLFQSIQHQMTADNYLQYIKSQGKDFWLQKFQEGFGVEFYRIRSDAKSGGGSK